MFTSGYIYDDNGTQLIKGSYDDVFGMPVINSINRKDKILTYKFDSIPQIAVIDLDNNKIQRDITNFSFLILLSYLDLEV